MNDQIAYALNDDILALSILPTEQCNFRCFYCYESFKLGKMSALLVESILKLIRKRGSDLKVLNIGWFGGEPLMAEDIVIYLSEEFSKLSKEFDFDYSAGITTNGYYLNSKLFNTLLKNGITSYQITLDGDKTAHDKIRTLANKDGTFEKIWGNLLAIKDINGDFTITLRIHYSPDNLSDIKKFSKLLNESFGDDKRFKIFFRNIAKLGGCNDEVLSTFSKEESKKIQNELNELSTNIEPLPIEDYVCYASKANSFIIRSNGDISKCTVALDEDVNIVGKLNENGELELNQDKCRLWSIGLQTENPEHLACPYGSLIKPNIVDMIKFNE